MFDHRTSFLSHQITDSDESVDEELKDWSDRGWELVAAIPFNNRYTGTGIQLFWKRPKRK